ncbi:MAG: effector-associated domain EAD1-containing protein, partial [Anaerolineae bacterium]
APAPPGPTDLDWAYRTAAAVLVAFRPGWLQPYGWTGPAEPGAVARLLADSTMIYDQENKPTWTLRQPVRRQALERLGSRQAMEEALAANPDRPDTPLQRTLEQAIGGALPPLAEQRLQELEHSLQVVQWLAGLVEPLPTAEEVRHRLEWARLLKPMHYLAGENFCGRAGELDQLRDYVGVLPPSSRVESIFRTVRQILSLKEKPPLLVWGPGGIGKSTLIAYFILEHAEAGDDYRFPFAYIDFDRPDVLAQEPATILVEAIRQLGLQYPVARELSQLVRQYWLREISQARADTSMLKSSSYVQQVAPAAISDHSPLLDDMYKILERVGEHDKPFLLVLDTFEQVQHRSAGFISDLWGMLDELQSRIPQLRTVIAGRAPVEAFHTQDLRLGDLDREAGEEFLKLHGIDDPALARQIVRQIGGNPLSLELAVQVIAREGAGRRGIRDLGGWKRLRLQLEEMSIQGYLYRRLLGYIPDKDVRKLAHPGLVLRRVTPDLIREVLAGPCGVEVADEAGARQLFDRLKQEVTLVTTEADGALRHRSDVRRIMLDALRHDEPLKVIDIHRRAAAYYHDQEGTRARAEEIYHLLFLEVEPARIGALWEPGVEAYLYPALEEVPERNRPLLAFYLGQIEAPPDWADADLETWESRIETRVRELVEGGQWQRALDLLSEREERTAGSRLYLAEAQALAGLERWTEARQVALKGLYTVSQGDDEGQLLALLRLSARIDEALGYHEQALEMLARAEDLIDADETLDHLEMTLARLRLYRQAPPEEKAVVDKARRRAAELADRVPPAELAGDRHRLRDLAIEVGPSHPRVLRQVLGMQQPRSLSTAQRQALAGALAAWDTVASREADDQPGRLARLIDLEAGPGADLYQTWSGFMQEVEPAYLPRLLGQLLEKHAAPEDVAVRLVDNLLSERAHVPESILQARIDRLTEQQHKALSQALYDAFDLNSLATMLRVQLDRELDQITPAGQLWDAVYDVIAAAERQGWVGDLIRAALTWHPDSEPLAAFARSLEPAAEPGSKGAAATTRSARHIDPDNPPYAALHELLTAAFGAEELRRFCQDRPAFRPVVDRLGPGFGLDDMVDQLIEYTATRLLWDELLAGVAQERPAQYERFAPQLFGT